MEENEKQKEINKQSILQQQEENGILQNALKQMEDASNNTDADHRRIVSSTNNFIYLSFFLSRISL